MGQLVRVLDRMIWLDKEIADELGGYTEFCQLAAEIRLSDLRLLLKIFKVKLEFLNVDFSGHFVGLLLKVQFRPGDGIAGERCAQDTSSPKL